VQNSLLKHACNKQEIFARYIATPYIASQATELFNFYSQFISIKMQWYGYRRFAPQV
jgi:hypothetical protein